MAPMQQALQIDTPQADRGRGGMKLEHPDIIAARRELLRHGFWPLGVGPREPETWADKQHRRRFCFRREGTGVRLVELRT